MDDIKLAEDAKRVFDEVGKTPSEFLAFLKQLTEINNANHHMDDLGEEFYFAYTAFISGTPLEK